MATEKTEYSRTIRYPVFRALAISSLIWVVLIALARVPGDIFILFTGLLLNLVIQISLLIFAEFRRWDRRRWLPIAVGSALVFAIPVFVMAKLETTPRSLFRYHIADPIPSSVTNIERRVNMGVDGWIAISFTATPETLENLLKERGYKPVSFELSKDIEQRIADPDLITEMRETKRRGRMRYQSYIGFSRLDIGDCDVFRASVDETRSYTFVVSKDRTRACVVYFRV